MVAIGISITRDPENRAEVFAGAFTTTINRVIMQLQMQGRKDTTPLSCQRYAAMVP